MSEEVVIPKDQALKLIADHGVFLVLGYHPRANVGLAMDLCVSMAREGSRVLVLDCDRNIMFNGSRSGLGEREVSRILLSHPADSASLVSDLRAAASMAGVGAVVLNRPSSLVRAFDRVGRYEEKRMLWHSVHPFLSAMAERCAVVVLEDCRKAEEVEYKVHPALYYLSATILDAVQDGKNVQEYRIIKRRPARS